MKKTKWNPTDVEIGKENKRKSNGKLSISFKKKKLEFFILEIIYNVKRFVPNFDFDLSKNFWKKSSKM